MSKRDDEFDSSGRFRESALRQYGKDDGLGAPAEIHGQVFDRRSSIRERVLALRAQIPHYPQVALADCGPAALHMALSYLGLASDFETLRRETMVGRDGASAGSLVRTARRHGATARGVRTPLSGLKNLGTGAILFWKFNHFVVLEHVGQNQLVIVDPASGRRTVTWAEADEAFTGVAIELSAEIRPHNTARRKRSGPSKFVMELLPRSARWAIAVGLSALIVAFGLLLPIGLQALVSSPATVAKASPVVVIVILVATVGGFCTLQALRAGTIVTLQSIVDRDVTRRLVGRLLRLPYSYFSNRHPGDLAQRARFGSRLRQVITPTSIGAAFDAFLALAFICIISFRFGTLAVTVLVWAAILVAIVAFTWRRQRLLASEALAAQVESTSTLHEFLENMVTIKSLGAEDEALTRWSNRFAAEVTASTRRARHSAFVAALLLTVQFAAPLSVLAVGAANFESGVAAAGNLVAMSTLTALLFSSLLNLSSTVSQLGPLSPEATRVNDVLTAKEEASSLKSFPQDNAGQIGVELDSVSFSYAPGAPSNLENITIRVEAGTYVGVLGASGSGKSTLGSIISGLQPPTTGRVALGGVDLSEVDARSVRRAIGYVDQNSRLMSGSIATNLRLAAPHASLAELRTAARIAEIDADVIALPMGYETVLGSAGEGLSGGQRQRLALARALVSRPSLLVLDEATSAVDPDTEAAIVRNLRSLGTTLVVIAHRLNLVAEADQILVLRKGQIIDSGSPAEVSDRRKRSGQILV